MTSTSPCLIRPKSAAALTSRAGALIGPVVDGHAAHHGVGVLLLRDAEEVRAATASMARTPRRAARGRTSDGRRGRGHRGQERRRIGDRLGRTATRDASRPRPASGRPDPAAARRARRALRSAACSASSSSPRCVQTAAGLEHGAPGQAGGPAVGVDAALVADPVDEPSLGELLVERRAMLGRDLGAQGVLGRRVASHGGWCRRQRSRNASTSSSGISPAVLSATSYPRERNCTASMYARTAGPTFGSSDSARELLLRPARGMQHCRGIAVGGEGLSGLDQLLGREPVRDRRRAPEQVADLPDGGTGPRNRVGEEVAGGHDARSRVYLWCSSAMASTCSRHRARCSTRPSSVSARTSIIWMARCCSMAAGLSVLSHSSRSLRHCFSSNAPGGGGDPRSHLGMQPAEQPQHRRSAAASSHLPAP